MNFTRGRLLVAIPILILVLIGAMVFSIVEKRREMQQVRIQSQNIPDLLLLSVNGDKEITRKNNGKFTVFFYVNSECDYCDYELDQVSANIEHFEDVNLFILYSEPSDSIRQFLTKKSMTRSVTALQISNQLAFSQFAFSTFPSIAIYSPGGKLEANYRGEMKIETILKHIRE